MIDYTKYSTAGLFYILCSCWNRFVKDEFRIDDEERDMIKSPITIEMLRNMLIELGNRQEVPMIWQLSCQYMATVMVGSKEWKKFKI